MSLFSIVAKEDFISIVLGNYESESTNDNLQEITTFREITPKQSFFLFTGDVEIDKKTWNLVEELAAAGSSLREIALAVRHEWINNGYSSDHLEAVIGGILAQEEIQYHLITNNREVQSFYPQPGESLYYASDGSLKLNAMEELAKNLMMKGMASVHQAQGAQLELLDKLAGTRPGTCLIPKTVVLEKVH